MKRCDKVAVSVILQAKSSFLQSNNLSKWSLATCEIVYLMKTLADITNIDVTLVAKVSAYIKTSGWGNWYLIV